LNILSLLVAEEVPIFLAAVEQVGTYRGLLRRLLAPILWLLAVVVLEGFQAPAFLPTG
jgi:hypothetical protein